MAVDEPAGDGVGISSFEAVLFGIRGVFSGGAFHPLTRSIWRQDLELFPRDQQATTLTGSVTDTAGGALAGATVQIVGTPHQTRADSSGSFEFANLTYGDIRIQARQVGYSPAEFDLDLPPNQTIHVPDEMLALVQFSARLRDIIITGDALRNNPRLDGFFERRATSTQGKFVTNEEWQKWLHFNMSDILDRTRYVRDKALLCTHPSATSIDGVHIPRLMLPPMLSDPEAFAAIEAYGNGNDAPVRYRRHGCGSVVLYWSKR